ncbi:Uncharacterised protein [uncultured archaeon]|nr:Uncharacterised protein [uncultured archaeon]
MKIYAEPLDVPLGDKHDRWSEKEYEAQRKHYDDVRFASEQDYIRVGNRDFKKKIRLGELICDFLKGSKIEGNVFCVGVGDAYTEIQLAQDGKKLLLTDFDTNTIEKYKKLFSESKELKFERFDLLNDSFEGIAKDYPVVLSTEVLYNFNDNEVLDIIERIKRAGFRDLIIISATHVKMQNALLRALKLFYVYFRMYVKRFNKCTKFYGYCRETYVYKRLLKKCGLSIDHVKEMDIDCCTILYHVRLDATLG